MRASGDASQAAAPRRAGRADVLSARVACALLVAIAGDAAAIDRTILIGGGNSLANSQAQIELNVKWVRELLEGSPGREVEVFYSDGDDPGADVVVQHPLQDADSELHPLARVFGAQDVNGEERRNHRVGTVAGGTSAGTLVPALQRRFASLRAGDSLTMVYNGHGSVDRQDPTANALMLWGDTRLDVRGLHAMLAGVDPAVPARWVFTQCFSGAFHRLAYRDPGRGLELAEGQRCGFTAESAWRMAEGCSASVAVGDYRDYTTFFFAALSGRTRQGEPLPAPADTDGDGRVSLREAHHYAVRHAYSTDLSRATSEDYLETWEPWFLRWQADARALPDNEFARIATAVAQREGIDPGGATGIRQARLAARTSHERLLAERRELRAQAARHAGAVRDPLLRRWPALAHPHTGGYLDTLRREQDAIVAWIAGHEAYPALRRAQQQLASLETRLLNAARRLAQVDKVARLRRLARLRHAFDTHASPAERSQYERLVACESAPLPGGELKAALPRATPRSPPAASARVRHTASTLIGASRLARTSARP